MDQDRCAALCTMRQLIEWRVKNFQICAVICRQTVAKCSITCEIPGHTWDIPLVRTRTETKVIKLSESFDHQNHQVLTSFTPFGP